MQLANIVRQAIEGMQTVAESAGVQLIHDKTQLEITADPDDPKRSTRVKAEWAREQIQNVE